MRGVNSPVMMLVCEFTTAPVRPGASGQVYFVPPETTKVPPDSNASALARCHAKALSVFGSVAIRQ